LQTKNNTYKSTTLQFVLAVLICIITIKPTIQFFSSFSISDNEIELNENIDFEDEVETEVDEAVFHSKHLDLQNHILTQEQIRFDNYSSQILVMYSDIFLPPPMFNI